MAIDLRFLLKLFLRRLHYFLLVALPVAALGLWLAFNLPSSYSAQARLLVESPQVPDDLAASTMRATTAEVLQVIAQRILTRANLLDLASKFGIYADQPDLNVDAKVEDMRRRVVIGLPGAYDAAPFITIAFASPDPRVSADVTNELVTQFLAANVELRTATTTQTLEFFDQEVARLEEELSRQSAQIVEFQDANRSALPDSLDFRRTRQATLQERLLLLEREIAGLRERRDRLVNRYESTGRIEVEDQAQTPEMVQLRQLQSELASAQVIYSEGNPRILALKRQIAALEELVAGQPSADGADEGTTMLDMQLTDIDGQVESLSAERDDTEAELKALSDTIDATAANAVTLEGLERDMANIQAQYNAAVARRAEAQTGERIESQSRGQRITIVEQATPPEKPTKPNRRAIAIAGVGGGMMLGLGLVVLLELTKSSVRRSSEIAARMGVAPFATIPYLRTRRQIVLRRMTIAAVLVVAVVAIPAGLWLFDRNVMPLDLALDRALERSGFDRLGVLLRPRDA